MSTSHLARATGAACAVVVGLACAAGPRTPIGSGATLQHVGTSDSSCRTATGDPPPAITWTLPGDPRERDVLDDWCATVGPAIGRLSPSDPAPARDAPIALVSWNVYVGRGDVVALVRALRDGSLTGGEPVHRYVLLLQEAVRAGEDVPALRGAHRLPRAFATPAAGRDIESIARTLGAAFVYAPSMRNSTRREDRGSAIVSNVPIGRVQAVELPMQKQRRVAVIASLHVLHLSPGARESAATAESRLVVASVHLDTAAGLGSGGPGAVRLRQAERLIAALSREGAPVVVGGDLNTWWGDDEPVVKAMRREFPDAAPLEARWTWRGPVGVVGKLDHLFARLGGTRIQVRRLSDRFGSDHFPLLALVPREALGGPAAASR